jgi:hypothetical protein
MNCNNYNTIKVTAGNAFSLLLPLKEKHYISEQPIEETINAALLTDVQVLLNNEEWSEFELGEDGVLVRFPSTLSKGVYNIELTAKYGGIAIRAAYFQCLSIVAWSYQSDAENYIPTSPLVADAAFVISVNGDEELTALKEQYRNAIAATEAEKAEYERKVAELDGVAQESTSQEILDKVRGIKGDNPNATNSAIYDAINAISPDLVQGKERLATAITSKGVETTSADSLSQMAENVSGISQESYTIDGGEMYAKQQFGDGALWNLYQVLADMKTRFMGTGDYSALIVCEYDKTDDSLTLQGADGYYTCDGDYYDYASPIHIWHDYDNNKFNRWVAFLYSQESIALAISDTAISPRSMYIGGHISTIRYLIEDRLTEFVCGTEDTDVVDKIIFSKNRSNKMTGYAVIKGVQYMECVDGFIFTGNTSNLADFISADVISCNKIVYQYYGTSIVLPYLEKINTTDIVCRICPSLKYLRMPSLKISNVTNRFFFDRISTSIIDVEVGAMETNLRLNIKAKMIELFK